MWFDLVFGALLIKVQTWYYFLGVVPTKMMVLSDKQDDEVSVVQGLPTR